MSDRSAIEWTDASWNPIRARNLATGKIGWHCEHATTGCEFCYSEGFNKRLGTGLPFKPGHRADIELFLDDKMLTLPLRWKKPRKIFVCSMTDLFADFVKDEWIDRVFAVMALCPQHTFQILTKRAERMRDYATAALNGQRPIASAAMKLRGSMIAAVQALSAWFDHDRDDRRPPPNIWLGVSCERQQEADERIPLLLQTPAAIRFISAEPLLGPIDLEHLVAPEKVEGEDWRFSALETGDIYNRRTFNEFDEKVFWDSGDGPYRDHALDWVIVGGESGHGARAFDVAWAELILNQCHSAGVPCFIKQLGARPIYYGQPLPRPPKDKKGGDLVEWPHDVRVREFPQVRA